ncbi:hypothetical protein PIB30_099348 [Stylosanthes scabra]|uniref:Uncharacterized protein n=1 Tax=Stylosanthes scabra TaxID=79078 RepID=A0ABU6SXE7_9FABA|nr:hypothetical protein [Stylosanthes scabra]
MVPFSCLRTSTTSSLVCDSVPSSTAAMASSSSVSIFDNYRFKSAFNEELYNSIVKNKKVIAECCIYLDEDEYPVVKEQIALRGWRRLAAPKQEISIDLIHEFYANAINRRGNGRGWRAYIQELCQGHLEAKHRPTKSANSAKAARTQPRC